MMKKLLAPVLGLLAVAIMADPALAQLIDPAKDSIGNLTNATGGAQGIKQVIITIVNFALGFLGLIAVLMIIYGGFKYMTGGEGGAEEGKKLIINALIGIIIILISFALVSTVLTAASGVAPQ